MSPESSLDATLANGPESAEPFHYVVNVSEVENLQKCLQSEFASLCAVLLRNLEKIRRIHMMPYHVAGHGVARFFYTVKYVETALQSGKTGEQAIRENTPVARELFANFLRQQSGHDELALAIDESVRELMHRPEFRQAMQMLFFVSIPLLWSAFETVARDSWVTLVNSADSRTVHRIFRKGADRGFDTANKEQSISVDRLAKFDFDLRGKFGLMLQDKFHFSSVSGMSRAYSAVSETFPAEIFEAKDLKRAEQLRHLIVHNAGIIDERYQKAVHSTQNVGEEVAVTDEDVSSVGCAVVHAAAGVLKFANAARERMTEFRQGRV